MLRGGAGLFFDRPDGNAIFPQVQNPPTYENVTVRYGQLQTLGSGGLTTEGAAGARRLRVRQQAAVVDAVERRRADDAAVGGRRSTSSYVGQHSFNTLQGVNLNAVDFGAAFLPQNQDPTLRAERHARRDGACRRI